MGDRWRAYCCSVWGHRLEDETEVGGFCTRCRKNITRPCCNWSAYEPWLPEYPVPHRCARSFTDEVA